MLKKANSDCTGGFVWNGKRELKQRSPTKHVDNDPFGSIVVRDREEIHSNGFVESEGSGQHCGRTGLNYLALCFAAFALEAMTNIVKNRGLGAAEAKC